jgi:hypothetical protein
LKITSTQGRLYVPSVTSSMNSLSSSSFLDMDRALFFRHRSWTWTETYSSNKPLHKLDVTARLLLWKQERRMCETMQSSLRLRPAIALVRALLAPTASSDGAGARFCAPLPTRKSRWSQVGTSKIILDFYSVICLVRWIMGRLGEVEREVVKKLDYQW